MNTPCKKCNGTGFRPEVAHVDGGRCWHCNKVDTSYTRLGSVEADLAAGAAQLEASKIARRARAAGRAAQ